MIKEIWQEAHKHETTKKQFEIIVTLSICYK
jgi:hypothetical protein